MVDSLLDTLTNGEHSKAMSVIEAVRKTRFISFYCALPSDIVTDILKKVVQTKLNFNLYKGGVDLQDFC